MYFCNLKNPKKEMAKVNIISPQDGFQKEFVRTNVDFCIGGGILGGGKALSVDEKVLTPNGWKRIGDVSVGDVICSPFNGTSNVTGVFPQGKKKLYRLKTNDGREILAHDEHLWYVRTDSQLEHFRKNNDAGRDFFVKKTSQIKEDLCKGKKLYIPIPKAFETSEKDFPIPPYLLGVLLGDGCLTYCSTAKRTLNISSDEEDIIRKCANLINVSYRFHNGNYNNVLIGDGCSQVNKSIRDFGLSIKSPFRFIPKEYLFGSIEQRKELLFGLFDTDGTVDRKNRYSFSTTSVALADDFVELCRGLGMIARKTKNKDSENYTSGSLFDVTILTNEKIFSSEKHGRRCEKNENNFAGKHRYNDHVKIESIEYEKDGECVCISVDDKDHLYIASDFIVTHNTFGAVLSVAEPSIDPNFRGLFLRNNLDDTKASGGILDTFREAYGNGVHIVKSENPTVTFPSGARIDVTHVSDQSRSRVLQRFKGRQYDMIYFDELTGFSWDCFAAIYTRNRGTAKWTGKVRATTNPDRDCWIRKFIDWYIGPDGTVSEDRSGVVRYFYMAGDTVDDVVWGDEKEEVYEKCRLQINRALNKIYGKEWKSRQNSSSLWKSMIKSFTFYLGKLSENKSLLEKNEDYVGSVAVMGGKNSQQLLEGNWNVSPSDDLDIPISTADANYVFTADKQMNGDRWVTCDLADTGTDNFIALAWDGFHIYDALIICQSTPRENAERLEMFAQSHDISDSHIIYDAIRGTYINDYISDAVQFLSYHAPMGMYGRMAYRLKDECYLRLCEALKRHNISMEDGLSKKIYTHLNIKENIIIQDEFIEECRVVRFKDMPSGKKTLFSKKEMNQKLGKGRSMDLLDPCAMRMLPCLSFPYGEELTGTSKAMREENEPNGDTVDIYNETNWF